MLGPRRRCRSGLVSMAIPAGAGSGPPIATAASRRSSHVRGRAEVIVKPRIGQSPASRSISAVVDNNSDDNVRSRLALPTFDGPQMRIFGPRSSARRAEAFKELDHMDGSPLSLYASSYASSASPCALLGVIWSTGEALTAGASNLVAWSP